MIFAIFLFGCVVTLLCLWFFGVLPVASLYGPRVLPRKDPGRLVWWLLKRVTKRYVVGQDRRMFWAAMAAIVVVYGAIVCWVMWPRTIYATGFSERGFAKIRPGMNASEARQLAGEPIYIQSTYWQYSRPGGSVLPEFRWNVRALIVSNDVVIEVWRNRAVL